MLCQLSQLVELSPASGEDGWLSFAHGERVAQNWIRRFKGGDTSLKHKPSQEDLLF